MRLFLLDPCGVLVRGQGVLLLLEGGLGVTHCRFLLLEGFSLLLEGPGQRSDGRLLALELGLLLLECRPNTLQLGSLCLGFMSLLLRRDPLDIALADGPRQLLLSSACWRAPRSVILVLASMFRSTKLALC